MLIPARRDSAQGRIGQGAPEKSLGGGFGQGDRVCPDARAALIRDQAAGAEVEEARVARVAGAAAEQPRAAEAVGAAPQGAAAVAAALRSAGRWG